MRFGHAQIAKIPRDQMEKIWAEREQEKLLVRLAALSVEGGKND